MYTLSSAKILNWLKVIKMGLKDTQHNFKWAISNLFKNLIKDSPGKFIIEIYKELSTYGKLEKVT
jgi:hypothetical protein